MNCFLVTTHYYKNKVEAELVINFPSKFVSDFEKWMFPRGYDHGCITVRVANADANADAVYDFDKRVRQVRDALNKCASAEIIEKLATLLKV